MAIQLPHDPHDFALWLLSNLEELTCVDNSSLWEGRLPSEIDFKEIETHLEGMPSALSGICNESDRTIGFYPSNVHIYSNIHQLLSQSKNLTLIPNRFTLRDSNFSYPSANDSPPISVSQYMDAVRLWSVLSDLADVRNGGLLFVASHEAQLTILPKFSFDNLCSIQSLSRFITEFSNEEFHSDQKRSIIRTILIEQFRPSRSVTLGDLLPKFDEIATNSRHSLAMYMDEFSVAKVKGEVERQNLEDTLSLNKTLSDIQNQLLALPAAILLAGATIKTDDILRNYAILAGVLVFTVFILILVSNQRHAIDAIALHIENRKNKVKNMPSDSSNGILPLFKTLESRIKKQKRTLFFISIVVCIVPLLTMAAVIYINHGEAIIHLSEKVLSYSKQSLMRLYEFFVQLSHTVPSL